MVDDIKTNAKQIDDQKIDIQKTDNQIANDVKTEEPKLINKNIRDKRLMKKR